MDEGKIGHHEDKPDPHKIYQQMLDRYLKIKLAKRQGAVIPETQRSLEKLGDYGYRMKICPQEEISASSLTQPDRWKNSRRTMATEYFFDFDDTIFDTTGYEAAIRTKLEACGISDEIAKKLYEESKMVDLKTGKKIHKRDLYINALKEQFPDKAVEIDAAFSEVKPKNFLNEDMAQLLRIMTASLGPSSRVHILTYGEVNFQRSKVEAVLGELGMPMDILYTQVPKAEFMDRYLKSENPYMQGEDTNVQSFVMVDDNPEELKTLAEFSKKQAFFVPIRLRKPTAKRSKIEQAGKGAYEITDHYARTLVEVKKALYDARYEQKISGKEWQEKDLVQIIQSDLDRLKNSPDGQILKIEQTAKGTLLITRRIYIQAGKREEIEDMVKEIGFDSENNTFYEVTTNPNDMMWRNGKRVEGKGSYHPWDEDYFEGEMAA